MGVSSLNRIAWRDSTINRQTQKGSCPANLLTSTNAAISAWRSIIKGRRPVHQYNNIDRSSTPTQRDICNNNKTGLARAPYKSFNRYSLCTRVYTHTCICYVVLRFWNIPGAKVLPRDHRDRLCYVIQCPTGNFSTKHINFSPSTFRFSFFFSSGDRLAIAETDRRSEDNFAPNFVKPRASLIVDSGKCRTNSRLLNDWHTFSHMKLASLKMVTITIVLLIGLL